MNPEDFDTSNTFPAADIQALTDGIDVRLNHSYAVVTPNSERAEFMLTIRASNIRAWRARLESLTRAAFPWAELLLSIASLGIGSVLSASLADVGLATTRGIFFFVIVPPLTTAAVVGYLFVRNIHNDSSSVVAGIILEEMPTPTDVEERK